MKKTLFVSLIASCSLGFANDYMDAKLLGEAQKHDLEQVMAHLNPSELIEGYTPNPKESALNPNALKEIASVEALKNEVARDAINRANNRAAVNLAEEKSAAEKGIDLGHSQNNSGLSWVLTSNQIIQDP